MTRKELEMSEEENRDLIEQLRSLSSAAQASPNFLSKVMAKADQFPPPRKGVLSWLTNWNIADPRIMARSLVVCLVVLTITAMAVLKVTRDREQVTFTRIAELQEELGKQQELLKELRQLIERVDRRALADFKLGRYEKSYQEYLKAAKQDPDKDVYRFRAALALWYDCQFGKAKELLEAYVEKNDEDVWGHFALGTTYHSLGDYQAAISEYKTVTDRDKGEAAEAAWFNLGVISALEFGKTQDPRNLRRVISHLERSIELARGISIARGKERIKKIQEALKPFYQRPAMQCAENYAPDDLSSLAKEEVFLNWVHEKTAMSIKAF